VNFSPLFIGEITSTARQRFYFQCDTSSHKESVSQTSFLQKIRGGLRNLRRRAAEDSGRLLCTWL